jgi:serine/threonine protein kinase
LHRAGWVWRDCKPKNIIVTANGRLAPIDFEGATPIGRPDPMRWGTPGFIAPLHSGKISDAKADDLYAFGAMLFLLVTGRIYDPEKELTVRGLRRDVPHKLIQLIGCLLSTEPARRPAIEAVHADLNSILRRLKRRRRASPDRRTAQLP